MGKKYASLVGLLEEIKKGEFGEWVIDTKSKGTEEDPIQWPYVDYSPVVDKLIGVVHEFVDKNPDYELTNYHTILEKHGLDWGTDSMSGADVSGMDGQGVMALLVGSVRAERFCDGALKSFLENGAIIRWLERLRQLDEAGEKR